MCVCLQYKATDYVAPGPGKAELVFTPVTGQEVRLPMFEFKKGGGVLMGMYNTDEVRCSCSNSTRYRYDVLLTSSRSEIVPKSVYSWCRGKNVAPW